MRSDRPEKAKLTLVVFGLDTLITPHDGIARCLAAALESVGVIISPGLAQALVGMPPPVAITPISAALPTLRALRDRGVHLLITSDLPECVTDVVRDRLGWCHLGLIDACLA